jgi:hypothetical protein
MTDTTRGYRPEAGRGTIRGLLLVGGALGAVACSQGLPGPSATSPSPAPATVFTLEDAGETATLRLGETIIVALEPVDDEPWSFFDYPEEILRPLVGQDGAPGRGFVAIAEGTGTIVAFTRAGAGDRPPGTRFELTVEVVG